MGQEVYLDTQRINMNNFRNLIQLFDYFKDEETCRTHLEKHRWGDNVACPHCGSLKVYRTNRGFKCGEKLCLKKFSATVGTIFENSKVPLRTWYAAMYLIASHKKGISSLQLHRDLGVTQKTAWFLLHRIRESLRQKTPVLLEDVVEVDETFIGGKNKNRHAHKKVPESQGRSTKDKTPVVGIKQRGGMITTIVGKDTKASTLQPFIKSVVKPGSIVITDEWGGYNGLNKEYSHVVIKHNEGEYVRGAFHTNEVEGVWSLFKRGYIGTYHYMSPKHMPRYFDEFNYRFNSRDIPDADRFEITLGRVAGRLKYKDLIANNNETKESNEAAGD